MRVLLSHILNDKQDFSKSLVGIEKHTCFQSREGDVLKVKAQKCFDFFAVKVNYTVSYPFVFASDLHRPSVCSTQV